MIITMLAMVHVCTLVRAKNEIIASKPRIFAGMYARFLCLTFSDFYGYFTPIYFLAVHHRL